MHRLQLRPENESSSGSSNLEGVAATCSLKIPQEFLERFNEAVEVMLRRESGSLTSHIRKHAAWGRNVPYFLTLLSRIVSVMLSPSQPLLTDRAIQDYFSLYAATSDSSLQSCIQDLSSLQLQILIAILITQRKMF